MDYNLLLAFAGTSLLLIIMPGPDNIYVLLESITNGKRNGVLISVGLVTGVLVHTIIASTGLSIIISQSDLLFDIIKYCGAAYLFYLAFLTFKEKWQSNEQSALAQKKSPFALIRKGFMMNVLNPKVSLFFIAFLPQFIDPNGINITFQMILLGLIFMVLALISFSTLALLAGKLADYLMSKRFWTITKYVKIGVFCVLGVFLIISQK